MAFTAKDVQALRERTGCGMMDCKKALVECDGDMEKAVDFLREKGLASQAKKATRVAAEGQVVTKVDGDVAAILEINAETDFVAGGEPFKALCDKVIDVIVKQNPADVEALLACKENGQTVDEMVQELFLQVRENMKVRRFYRTEGKCASYIHAGGRIGVLVEFDTTDDIAAKDEFAALGKSVAMHIAAMNPAYLDEASVPAEVIAKEKEIMVAQMKEDPKMANKPEMVLNKIVEGKIGKFFKENCLVEQVFAIDGDYTVGKYVEKIAKELGGDIKVKAYTRFEKGEGIEKKVENFAEEIANMVK